MPRLAVVLAFLLAFLAHGAAMADKPDHAGKGKDKGKPAAGKPGGNSSLIVIERDRRVILDFYGDEFRAGSCPPGLAKKGNGCLPPGQAKKQWQLGRRLPPDVIYLPLPSALQFRLPRPPAGHEYVRVANDILLMALGTRLIVEAVVDLSNL